MCIAFREARWQWQSLTALNARWPTRLISIPSNCAPHHFAALIISSERRARAPHHSKEKSSRGAPPIAVRQNSSISFRVTDDIVATIITSHERRRRKRPSATPLRLEGSVKPQAYSRSVAKTKWGGRGGLPPMSERGIIIHRCVRRLILWRVDSASEIRRPWRDALGAIVW